MVLEDQLIPFMNFHGATHFLQDGAPCHASKRIKKFLIDKPFEVNRLAWEQFRTESYRKLLEFHEGEVEDKGHRVCVEADPGDQDAVDHWPQ